MALSLVVLVAQVYMAPVAEAELSTGATEAEPGSSLRVSGSGYLPVVNVRLCWDAPRCNDLGTAEMGVLSTSFSETVTVPLLATPGAHQIFACQTSCQTTSVEVVVEPPAPPVTPVETTTTTTPTAKPTPTTTTTTTAPPTTAVDQGSPVPPADDPPTTTTTPGETKGSVPSATTTIGSDSEQPTTVPRDVSADPNASPAADESAGEPGVAGSSDEEPADRSYTPPVVTTSRGEPPQDRSVGTERTIEAAGFDLPTGLGGTTAGTLESPLGFWMLWLVIVGAAAGLFYALARGVVGELER